MRSFADPGTHFRIVTSDSPVSVDGFAMNEPMRLECVECGASVQIDGPDETRTTIDELPHDRTCSQRDVKSRYWMRTFAGIDVDA